MERIRKIVITGPTAVGKSSIVSRICTNMINKNKTVIIVPEYIDVLPDAGEKLQQYLRKEITPFEFQWYVSSFYDKYLGSLEVTGDEIMLFERIPDDPLVCYANIDHDNGDISTQELFKIYELIQNTNKKYFLPSYFNMNDQTTFISLKSNLVSSDASIVSSIIESESDYRNIIVGLYNTTDKLYERLKIRNRPGEMDGYSINRLDAHNRTYLNLFSALQKGTRLSFTSIGMFL
jgi:GTPase SAR1 family protein